MCQWKAHRVCIHRAFYWKHLSIPADRTGVFLYLLYIIWLLLAKFSPKLYFGLYQMPSLSWEPMAFSFWPEFVHLMNISSLFPDIPLPDSCSTAPGQILTKLTREAWKSQTNKPCPRPVSKHQNLWGDSCLFVMLRNKFSTLCTAVSYSTTEL